jgi:hypothetical protein
LNASTQIMQDSPLPYTSTVHQVTLPSPDELTQSLQLLDISLNVTEPAVSETITLTGTHPTLGLVTEDHLEYTDTVNLKQIHPGTVCHKTIPRWKSQLRGSIVHMIDDITVENSQQIPGIICLKRQQGKSHVKIQFVRPI